MMKMERTMDASEDFNQGNVDRGTRNRVYGGKGIIKPSFGFGRGYAIGSPCWGKGDAFVFVSYCANMRDVPGVEGFGPDENGNLISLGKLAPGWIIMSGDPGGISRKNAPI